MKKASDNGSEDCLGNLPAINDTFENDIVTNFFFKINSTKLETFYITFSSNSKKKLS